MNYFEIFIIALGLSMDAFAVAICIGLSLDKAIFPKMLVVGLYFGLFQAVMPIIGYLLGFRLADSIQKYDHWIAFALLCLIGGKMVHGGMKGDGKDKEKDGHYSLSVKTMLPLALATSIDALAVGVTFAFLSINIVPAASLIGITTLVLSMVGVRIGGAFGARFKKKAEIMGGIMLVLIGAKVLLEHTGIL